MGYSYSFRGNPISLIGLERFMQFRALNWIAVEDSCFMDKLSSSSKKALVHGGKLVVHIDEDEHSFGLNCNEVYPHCSWNHVV